jgi:16S rRNA (cytosine967-C5)-methyltransferase
LSLKKTKQRVITSRQLAASILIKWEKLSLSRLTPLAQLVESSLENTGNWSVKDRALIRELVFGVVRWLRLLDWHIDLCLISRKKRLASIIRSHLRVGAFQILFLDRIPFSAAVNEAVLGVKSSNQAWAAGLVNAVLRRIAARCESLGQETARKCENADGIDQIERLAIETSHPFWMVNRWVMKYGLEKALAICNYNNIRPSLTLRINTLIITKDEILNNLKGNGLNALPGRYSSEALIISGYSGSPQAIPGFDQGWFQVQDESSQLVSYCVDPKPGEIILDACAGVGGKTTHLAQLIRDNGVIEATDKNEARLKLLEENQKRLGIKCISCMPFKLFKKRFTWLKERYNRILLDAPCSGLGVIRRHPDIKWNRTPASISELAFQQKSLLNSLASLVIPGGIIVYAVCTREPEETTEVVEDFLSGHPGWHIVPANKILQGPAASLIDENGFLSIFSGPHNLDGFFAAVLKSI